MVEKQRGLASFPIVFPDPQNLWVSISPEPCLAQEPLGVVQGWVRPRMLHRPCRYPGNRGTCHLQSMGLGSPGGPLPSCPMAGLGQAPRLPCSAFRLPGLGSPSCHFSPCPTAGGSRHRVLLQLQHPGRQAGRSVRADPPQALGSRCPALVAFGSRRQNPPKPRVRGSRGAGGELGAAKGSGPAVLRA